jgi:hypothetical protein
MRKIFFFAIFIFLALLSNITSADEGKKNNELKINSQHIIKDINKTLQFQKKYNNLKRNYYAQKSLEFKKALSKSSNRKLFFNTRGNEKVYYKPSPSKILISDVKINGTTDATISFGDTIVLTFKFNTNYLSANINLYIDDGDGILNSGDLNTFGFGTVIDNDEEDTDYRFGYYKLELTDDILNVFSGMNGKSAKFFFEVIDVGGKGVASLTVNFPNFNYSISGDVNPDEPFVLIFAFPENVIDPFEDGPIFVTITDAKGNYKVPVDTSGNWIVVPFDPFGVLSGFLPPFEKIIEVKGHETGINFTFKPATSFILAKVEDENTKPVVGAGILLISFDGPVIFGLTGTDGTVKIGIAPGVYDIVIDPESIIPSYLWPSVIIEGVLVLEGETKNISFNVYSVDKQITGKVFKDSVAIGGVKIIAESTLGNTFAYSNLDGTYSLSVASESDALGGYFVNADGVPRGYYIKESAYLNVKTGATNINFNLVHSDGAIQGYVKDEKTGMPVEDALVDAFSRTGGFDYTATDKNGYFILYVPNGIYTVIAGRFPDYPSQSIDSVVVQNDTVNVNFKIVRVVPGSISGNVKEDGGGPISRALVEVLGEFDFYETLTDKNGNYKVGELPKGNYLVSASKEGFLPEFYNDKTDIFDADTVKVFNEQDTPNINFSLLHAATITGTVKDSTGTFPVPFALVWAVDVYSLEIISIAVTDTSGKYNLYVPSGEYFAVGVIFVSEDSLLLEFYNEADVLSEADTLAVVAPNVYSNINFTPGGKNKPSNITNKRLKNIPNNYNISQNYPNPFNPVTEIAYQIPKDGKVTLKIYNILGQEIKTLISEKQKVGHYKIKWDGKNNSGNSASSGIYLYRIVVENSKGKNFIKVKKMVLVK